MAGMEKPHSSHPWIARYCIRTLQLLPLLPAPVAIRWAVRGYPYCSDDEPEHAAERFVDARNANIANQPPLARRDADERFRR
jgi:hypothetical protein